MSYRQKITPVKKEDINSELFQWNRSRFARQMRTDSIAIFFSNDLVSSNGETHRRFRQHPDLYFLTGITQQETVLVLAPNTAKMGCEEMLFIRRADTRLAKLKGPGLDLQKAAQLSGIKEVRFVDELDDFLHELVLLASRIYINTREDRHAYSEAQTQDLRFAERLMKLYPAHKYHRAQPILKKIGMVKSAPEVGLICSAIDIANLGLQAAANVVRAQNKEQDLEAHISQAIIAAGSHGLAHPIRIASGQMTTFPEYDQNAGVLKDGETASVQIGVMYAGYNASIARTFPIGGTFNERQKQVYQAVEDILSSGMQALVPGTTLPDCERQITELLIQKLEDLGIDQAKPDIHYSSLCYSHIGRNLRDPYEVYAPLQSGMVISCSPAIYLPEENLGIVLRNVILVTDEGPVDLCAAIPTDIEAIEGLVGLVH